MRMRIKAWWLGGMALCAVLHAHAGDLRFDMTRSEFGFELDTRWGQQLVGRFPRFDGKVVALADGQQQVQLRMYTREVEIVGHPRYTKWARGERFFAADAWPAVMFVSRPYDPAVVRTGGPLAGSLSIRGVTRPETLTVQRANCERAGLDCDVVVTGTVRRSDYGMDAFGLAMGDKVVFVLRSRLREAPLETPP